MNPDRRCRIEAAGQRLGRGSAVERSHKEIEDALVLRDIGVALLHHVIAPGKVAVELAARPGGAGDDELSVPLVRQPDQDPGLAGRIVGDARIELDTRHFLGDRRAVRRAGRDDGAVGLRRKGEGREGRGQGIVGRRGGGIVCGEVGALEAIGVGYLVSEPDEKLVAPGRGHRRRPGGENRTQNQRANPARTRAVRHT